jgi:SRSO17 transposase
MPVAARALNPWQRSRRRVESRRKHQSLLHFVGQGGWSDAEVLAKVRELVFKSMLVIALSPGDLAAPGMKDGDIRG